MKKSLPLLGLLTFAIVALLVLKDNKPQPVSPEAQVKHNPAPAPVEQASTNTNLMQVHVAGIVLK